MTSEPVCRRAAPALIALALAIGTWPSPARGAAVVTTAFGANDIVIYPTPNAGLPNPAAIPVSGLPADAHPQGVSCFQPDTCLVSDNGNFRIFVVRVSTASVVDTIDTHSALYAGGGTLAVNPQHTFALALDPFFASGQVTVIAAPFTSSATITRVFINGVLNGGTQSIVFAPSGRAFVCTGTSIAVIDPPYSALAFTMALPAQSGCSELAITSDGGVLLAPSAHQVNIFTAPFTAGSTAAVLPLPQADFLAGAAVTSDGTKALVVDQNGDALWAISAPFSAASPVEKIALPPLFPTLRQIAISPDDELAIVTGSGGASPRAAFVRRPFTSAGATAFDVFIEGGIGIGGASFLGPAGPPGPPSTPCGPVSVAGAVELAALDLQIPAANGTVPLVAAVLPSSRSVRVGCPATAFVTVINDGEETATGVGISPATPVPADFLYQTTNPATNALTGTPNTPVNIGAGQAQTFVIALTPRSATNPTDVAFNFGGANTAPVPTLVGVNTLLLSSSLSDVPDIVALAATQNNNGIVDVPAASNAGAFAVATVNVGLGASITVSADTGGVALPLAVFVCQTNAQGGCLADPAPSVTAFIDGSATPTFAFFAVAQGPIAFDPAANRIFARFKDAGGVTRGATSVAVRTTP